VLVFQLSGIPSTYALFIILRKRFSFAFLSSRMALVGMSSGPVAAPLGEAFMALSSSAMVIPLVVVVVLPGAGRLCSPPYSALCSSSAMWGCSETSVPSGLVRAGMGLFVVMGLTLLKHSGSVSSCRLLALASSFALAIACL